jgi:hypothetical protein
MLLSCISWRRAPAANLRDLQVRVVNFSSHSCEANLRKGFATRGMSIIARLEVIGGAGSICVERFEDYVRESFRG